MKKIKIGVSFWLLVLICLLTKNLVILINYFFALTLHEFAHLLVATSRGYSLKFVKLDIGGLAILLNEEIEDKDCFLINLAGPVVNILICLICMSLYWLVPVSFVYLNTFCMANLMLAVFNLLPIYPLDGGKIFYKMITNKKLFNLLEKIFRYGFSLLFLVMFICTFKTKVNYLFVVVSLFFIINKQNFKPTFSIFKYKTNDILKINLLKVGEDENLFSLIKRIKKNNYTIFYCNTAKQKYIDEDTIINLSLSYNLKTKLSEIKTLF